MEIVGVPIERNGGERFHRIGSIAAVKLAEVHSQYRVLQLCKNSVADIFVERHAAAKGGTRRDHARTEHRVGYPLLKGTEQGGEHFRRVLTVAVQERDKI